MKSPSRRLRRLVGAGVAGLLAVGLAPVLTSGVCRRCITRSQSTRLLGARPDGHRYRSGRNRRRRHPHRHVERHVRRRRPDHVAGGPARRRHSRRRSHGRPRTRTATTPTGTAQSGVGDRRFVSFAATPTAAGPGRRYAHAASGRSLVVDLSWHQRHRSRLLQRAGRRHEDRHLRLHRRHGRRGPDRDQQHQVRRRSWYRARRTTPARRTALNSTTTGPVRIFMFFSNVKNGVTTLTKANSADGATSRPRLRLRGTDLDSNAWVTTNTLDGSAQGVHDHHRWQPPCTQDHQRHHDGGAGRRCVGCRLARINNTFCIDIASGNAVFLSSPSAHGHGQRPGDRPPAVDRRARLAPAPAARTLECRSPSPTTRRTCCRR